jgi:outer membrane receptor protein involved in Fe transport
MKPRSLVTLLATCLFSAVPTAAAQSKPPSADEPVSLSPFEVRADNDTGYAVRETLAGTRFRSELKDVPAQVSVMTKEFLSDIGAVTVEDAFRFSLNVEPVKEFVSVTDQGSNPRLQNRIRGIQAPGITHDFFPSRTRQDTYNTEMVSFASGPNAILFGQANAAGVVDVGFSRANLQRPRYSVSFRNDNYHSERVSLDLNQPLLKEQVALRVAAVRSRENSWKKPAGRDDDRYYGTLTLKPFKSTTVRVWGEKVKIDDAYTRNNRVPDLVTPWIKAGRPAFDNGLNNPTTITAANNSYFVRNGTSQPVLVLGGAGSVPYLSWFSSGNITAQTTAYAANTIGPGNSPNQTGIDVFNYSLPYDGTISPFNVHVYGNSVRQLTDSKILGGVVEQRLPGEFFLEIAANRESARQPNWIMLQDAGIRADANLFLPDRVTPNPNFGRYYVEATAPNYYVFRYESREARVMLSRDADFTKFVDWRKWLGRHRLAGMYLRSEGMDVLQLPVSRLIPANVTATSEVIDRYVSFGQPAFRFYLANPKDPKTGGQFHVQLPFDPTKTSVFTMPDGSRYSTGIENPFGGAAGATMNNGLTESRVLAVQSFFFKDRLVTSFGTRSDNVRRAPFVVPQKTANPNSAYYSVFDFGPPKKWSIYSGGSTQTAGAVAHVLPWLSLFYNRSSTWNPITIYVNPVNGSFYPGSIGQGKDYGVMLRLFDNRLSLRLNLYTNTSGPTINVTYRNGILPVVRNIEMTLQQALKAGRISSLRPTPYYDTNIALYTQDTLTADQVSKGEEFELIFNPTRNWRISVNGAHSQTTASNIGREWFDFIRQRAEVWEANKTLTGPDNDPTSIATRYLGVIQQLNVTAQADGMRVEQGRDWRANALTRYSFSEGKLRGTFIGGGYRWRSPDVIGYRASLTDNAFKFTGAPDQVLVPALRNPIRGRSLTETEAFVGYGRRLGRKVDWRAQLNVRNLFDNQDPIAQRANLTTGATAIYTVPEGRSFILTNTFSF